MTDENEKLTPEDIAAAEQPVETPEPDPLAEKDAEITDLKDRMLRAVAETENVRRRLEREKADAVAYAVTGFARDLLGVADNLRRALDAAAKDDVVASPLLSGVEITEKELLKAFDKHGIARIESVGQKLDPNRHQAMLEVEQEGAEPGTIVAELQTGYVLKERLLRPAMVTVAKAG
ncbi:nucleotide exchange factor GrpE [Sphingosinicella soli]|uniref:Protein GrpE n=1 Tax=Sphingosinicella soli TaxID=333708 RepID=A0A7W7B0E2_9SPHN|nr:nucleotide exchange factor GrpE [Sphingosinicella soli]MBB4631707.1 molecular chaperone GrpE [Sphingosinicella soli]